MSNDLTRRIEAILGETLEACSERECSTWVEGQEHAIPRLASLIAEERASARREALEEAVIVASAKLQIPEGTYIEPKFNNYKGGLHDAAQTIATRFRAMLKHEGVK